MSSAAGSRPTARRTPRAATENHRPGTTAKARTHQRLGLADGVVGVVHDERERKEDPRMSQALRLWTIVMLGASGLFTDGTVWHAWERVWIWRRLTLPEYSVDCHRTLHGS